MKSQQGQILLIAVMLLATVLTVVLSLSFKSSTETQVTKLEEENQKALAAAEAGIETALKQGTVNIGSLPGLANFTGSAGVSNTQGNSFSSPLILQDESYTFYLGDYNAQTNTFGSSLAENLTVCFPSASPNLALEITLLKTASLKKYSVDPNGRIANSYPSAGACPVEASAYPYSFVIQAADISNNTKVMIVRLFFNDGKILITRSSNLPLQGQTIVSNATSTAGVSKSVQLFQSYPQISSESMVTNF